MDASISVRLGEIAGYLATPIWYKNLDLWNIFALVITAGIIFWYTLETKKLRVEAQKTNKFTLRPVVVAKYITSESNGRRDLKMMNIGKGPALNIKCLISQIHINKGYTNLRDLASNEKFNNLGTDEKQAIRRITTIDLYRSADGSEFSHGIPGKFVIIFIYEDVAGYKYQTITLIEIIEGTPTIKTTVTDGYDSGKLKNIV